MCCCPACMSHVDTRQQHMDRSYMMVTCPWPLFILVPFSFHRNLLNKYYIVDYTDFALHHILVVYTKKEHFQVGWRLPKREQARPNHIDPHLQPVINLIVNNFDMQLRQPKRKGKNWRNKRGQVMKSYPRSQPHRAQLDPVTYHNDCFSQFIKSSCHGE